jgi:hypothetical protein
MKLSNLKEGDDRAVARELLKLASAVKQIASRKVKDRVAGQHLQKALHSLDNAIDILQDAENVY